MLSPASGAPSSMTLRRLLASCRCRVPSSRGRPTSHGDTARCSSVILSGDVLEIYADI